MNFERKWCHECSGIQLFGEHKGKACCSAMSRILKNRETGEPIRAYMDKETTRNMCRNLGEGCQGAKENACPGCRYNPAYWDHAKYIGPSRRRLRKLRKEAQRSEHWDM